MKKLLLFVLAAVAFAACEQAPVEEQSAIRQDAPETITVGFEGDDTRIQLNEAQKTVWTKGDEVSVFYKSDANQKYEYRGETGERTAELHKVSAGSSTTKMGYVVVAYPYSEEYIISPATGNLETMLPAVQHYAVDSYGVGDNLMVSSSEFTQFSLKSVCGWLKLQLTGNGEKVKSITLRGNNGEQVAGLIHVDTKSAEATLYSEEVAPDDNGNANGSLVIDGAMVTELTLDCGEGVTLGKEATAFYIALPPQTFENGLTIEIEDTDALKMTKSTDKAVIIERNHIQPMAALEFINPNGPTQPTPASNQILYTSSDGNIVEPNNTIFFGATIISNEYNNGMGVITFDGDVTTIGNYAFEYCTSLTSVNIPDSVTTIGVWAFEGCDSLTEFKGKFAEDNGRILVIDGVLTAFAPAGITEYNIPDSVTTIGYSAFDYCTSLTSVTIPDSVTSIGSYAFSWCDCLTSVTIGDSVTSIGYDAFEYCGSLTSVYCKATTSPVLYGDSVFDNNGSGRKIYVPAGSVNAYKSATRWSEYADAIVGYDFENGEIVEVQPNNEIWYYAPEKINPYDSDVFGADMLTNEWDSTTNKGVITFDGDVTMIGDEAFYSYSNFSNCKKMTNIYMPKSVVSIGQAAFCDCTNLTDITLPNSILEIGDSAFSGCYRLKSVAMGNSVNTIGQCAFKDCGFNNIDIPNSVSSIGLGAFEGCQIERIIWPDSVTKVGDRMFHNCSHLVEIIIPDSVTSIGNSVFRECHDLISITLPKSIEYIGNWAFYNSNLKELYIEAPKPPIIYNNTFGEGSGFLELEVLAVPVESVKKYKSATYWNGYASAIVGYDFENGVVVE